MTMKIIIMMLSAADSNKSKRRRKQNDGKQYFLKHIHFIDKRYKIINKYVCIPTYPSNYSFTFTFTFTSLVKSPHNQYKEKYKKQPSQPNWQIASQAASAGLFGWNHIISHHIHYLCVCLWIYVCLACLILLLKWMGGDM